MSQREGEQRRTPARIERPPFLLRDCIVAAGENKEVASLMVVARTVLTQDRCRRGEKVTAPHAAGKREALARVVWAA